MTNTLILFISKIIILYKQSLKPKNFSIITLKTIGKSNILTYFFSDFPQSFDGNYVVYGRAPVNEVFETPVNNDRMIECMLSSNGIMTLKVHR